MRVAWVIVLAPAICEARVHPRFEPTDLELETSGTLELDTQLGYVKGPDAERIVAPDFELDLGLFDRFELDFDGSLAFARSGTLVDNSWLSAKIGLFDTHGTDRSWALGMQVGPKLPLQAGARGIGFEGLALLAYMAGSLHVVLSAGGLADPHDGAAPRPIGVEAGLDVELELVPDRWSLLGEIGGVRYRSDDPAQLAATAGIQLSPAKWLDVSLVALVGLAGGSDPFGVLLGISPKISLW